MVDLGDVKLNCKPENLALLDEDDSDSIPELVESSEDESADEKPSKNPQAKGPVLPPQPSKTAAKIVSNQKPASAAQPSKAAAKAANDQKPSASAPERSANPSGQKQTGANSKTAEFKPKLGIPVDDDDDEPPDLVSSSEDENEPISHQPPVQQPIPKPGSTKPGATKAVSDRNESIPVSSPQTTVPQVGAQPPLDKKQELQQFISKRTDEARSAFARLEYQESCRKYNEIVLRLEKLSGSEKKEFQNHLFRAYVWIAESHLQQGVYDLATTNGQKAMVVKLNFLVPKDYASETFAPPRD